MPVLAGARVVLGVAGGIAAYKAADLASRLVQAGALVDVILTEGAKRFVRPLTFSALTHRPVRTDLFAPWSADDSGHVSLAANADVLVVAPATASTIARLAHGLADDLLGAVALSTRAPLVLAPAMEHNMLSHPATQANIATVAARGATIVPPDTGRLASGAMGDGRLAATEAIVGTLRAVLGRTGPLAGRRIVVTAGGTQEPIDPVRFIGNRSSGRMGIALAEAAIERGASAVLVATSNVPSPSLPVDVVRVGTADEMRVAVEGALVGADALIMAAAVADFRPLSPATHKLKKQPNEEMRRLDLVRTPDILASVSRERMVTIGFAAETEDLVANAERKLREKGLDLIVANDAVDAIGSAESQAVIVERGRPPQPLPMMGKEALAEIILDRTVDLVSRRLPERATERR